MKKIIITGLLAASASVGAFAQGTIAFDNQNNATSTISSPAGGEVYNQTTSALETGNWNLQLFGGSTSSNMVLIATLLQSDGSAITGAAAGAPGQWIDSTGLSYVVPGVPISGVGFFDVKAWEGGNGSSYAGAVAGGATLTGDSGTFQNGTGGGPVPAPDLIGMPSLTLSPVPEPATLALCGLGAASLLLLRRKK